MVTWYEKGDVRLIRSAPLSLETFDELVFAAGTQWERIFAGWCEYHRVTNSVTDASLLLYAVSDFADVVDLLTRVYEVIPPPWEEAMFPVATARELSHPLKDRLRGALLEVDRVRPLDPGALAALWEDHRTRGDDDLEDAKRELEAELEEYGGFGALAWLLLVEQDLFGDWVLALYQAAEEYLRQIKTAFIGECAELARFATDSSRPEGDPVRQKVEIRLMAEGRSWSFGGSWAETIQPIADAGFPEPTPEERELQVRRALERGKSNRTLLSRPHVELAATTVSADEVKFVLAAAVGKQDATALNKPVLQSISAPGGECLYVQFGKVVLMSGEPRDLLPIWCLVQSASVVADAVPAGLSLGRITRRAAKRGRWLDRGGYWEVTRMLGSYEKDLAAAFRAIGQHDTIEFV
jgi:hypothetical protein